MKHYRAYLHLGLFHGENKEDATEASLEFTYQCLQDMLARGDIELSITEIENCIDPVTGEDSGPDGCEEYE